MVGASHAKQIMLLGEKMDANTAKEWGLVDWLTPAGKTLNRAKVLAEQVIKSPSHVVKMSKQSVNAFANAFNHVSTFMDVDKPWCVAKVLKHNKHALLLDKSKLRRGRHAFF